jgi:hypothetical protein
MTFIIWIKFMEYFRAIQIIKRENKMDEEIVKIHLFDQIASYRPEYDIWSFSFLILGLVAVINTLMLYWIIPYTSRPEGIPFLALYMSYLLAFESIFLIYFSYNYYNLKILMERYRSEEYNVI